MIGSPPGVRGVGRALNVGLYKQLHGLLLDGLVGGL